MELKHKSQRRAAPQSQAGITLPADLFAHQLVAARSHGFEKSKDIEKRALARPGWPHQCDKLTPSDLQIQPMQDFRLAGQAQVLGFAQACE